MSWDISLTDDRGHVEGEWNYTYNTSPMIYEAIKRAGIELNDLRWGEALAACDGPAGAEFLHAIITQLEADPAHFEAMNPANRWGSYSELLDVLRSMRSAVPEWPCRWEAS